MRWTSTRESTWLLPTARTQTRTRRTHPTSTVTLCFWPGLLRGAPARLYSPKCLEGKFCELRVDGVLRSSSLSRCSDVLCAMAHIHFPKTRVRCLRYLPLGRRTHLKGGRTDEGTAFPDRDRRWPRACMGHPHRLRF